MNKDAQGRRKVERFESNWKCGLNPVAYVWAYWKQHELPNVCPKDYGDLSQTARRTLRRVRRRKRLIPYFWKQAKLSFE